MLCGVACQRQSEGVTARCSQRCCRGWLGLGLAIAAPLVARPHSAFGIVASISSTVVGQTYRAERERLRPRPPRRRGLNPVQAANANANAHTENALRHRLESQWRSRSASAAARSRRRHRARTMRRRPRRAPRALPIAAITDPALTSTAPADRAAAAGLLRRDRRGRRCDRAAGVARRRPLGARLHRRRRPLLLRVPRPRGRLPGGGRAQRPGAARRHAGSRPGDVPRLRPRARRRDRRRRAHRRQRASCRPRAQRVRVLRRRAGSDHGDARWSSSRR